jgi:phosphohistidine phosphatase
VPESALVPFLVLLRHAKSDWDGSWEDDRQRPLARRGRRAAITMGRFLGRAGVVPDAALSSPARRAIDTLRLTREAAGWSCPVQEAPGLYGEGSAGALAEIGARGGGAEVLVVVGHEPDTSQLVALLVGGGRLRVPTAAAVGIALDVRWAEVGPATGELAWLLVPRLFRKDAFDFAE